MEYDKSKIFHRLKFVNEFVTLVPARAGSKGVLNKNTRLLYGHPLYAWAIRMGKKISSKVILSTDIDSSLLDSKYTEDVDLLPRPDCISKDSSTMDEVIMHFIKSTALNPSTIIILLQPTSPLRTELDLFNAFDIYFKETPELLLSVVSSDSSILKYGTVSGNKFNPLSLKYCFQNRQELPKVYRPNGAIYMFSVNSYLRNGGLSCSEISCIEMPLERSIDIDTEVDFEKANDFMVANCKEFLF